MVTQFCKIKVLVNAGTEGGNHRLNFRIAIDAVHSRLFHIEDFSAQRQNRLCFPVSGRLCGAACRISLDDKNLALLRIFAGTVCELTGQCHAVQRGFSARQIARLSGCRACALCKNCLVANLLCHSRILLQKISELLAEHRADRTRNLGISQFLLGLSLKLRIFYLD